MDIRDIYKKYVALQEQATMTVSADSAEEIASLLGIMKNAGLEQSGVVVSHDDNKGCGCAACSGMSDGDEASSWDNSPDTSMADLADITFLAGGGPNAPKHPKDIRVKDPSAFESEEEVSEWDNEPDEEYKDDDHMINTLSGGINKKKTMYKAAQPGDNAMAAESIKETLLKALSEKKKSKPDFLDVDKDGDKKEPMKKALKDKKKPPVDEAKIDTLTGDVLQQISSISTLDDMKEQAVELIKKSNTTPDKKRALINNISKSRNRENLIGLLYYSLLSGEGLASLDSRYQSRF